MAGNLHVPVFGNEFCLTLSQKPLFLRICSKSLENTGGKGEVAREEQFLLFPQYLPPFWRTFCHFSIISKCRLQTLSVWKSLKFVIWERVDLIQLLSTITFNLDLGRFVKYELKKDTTSVRPNMVTK